jgi:hypothetical protein
MPIFEITSPEGKTFEVTGPEGSTKEQALEKVKAQHAVAPAEDQRSGIGDFIKSIPRGAVTGLMSAGSAISKATAGEMGQPELQAEIPGPQQSTQLIEKHVTGELPKPQGRAGRFGEAVGEVLGNPASYVGPGSLALKAGAGTASALGAEAAGQLTEGSALETPARLIGGAVTGGGIGVVASERNLAKLAAQLPTPEKIKAAATAGYEYLKKSDTRISPEGTQALLSDVKTNLHAENFRDYLAPSTYRAIEELGTSGSATIGDLDGVRRLLNRVPGTNPTDREAARQAIKAIDDFMINVPDHFVMSGDPAKDAAILRHSQASWALHKQLEMLDEASVKGQHRAGVSGSGANRVNTARQEIRKILDSDKKSRGMSDSVKDKMEEIVMGTWLTNAARQIGKFAPSGPVSATTSVLTGMGAGAPAGAAVAGTGFLAKHLGEYLTDRQIRELEQIMRAESPIGKPIARAIAPEIAAQRAVPAATVARSVLTSPLAPGGP